MDTAIITSIISAAAAIISSVATSLVNYLTSRPKIKLQRLQDAATQLCAQRKAIDKYVAILDSLNAEAESGVMPKIKSGAAYKIEVNEKVFHEINAKPATPSRIDELVDAINEMSPKE